MRGESLAAAVLRWQGIDGDRQYAFLREANRSRFPWLIARELSELVRYTPRYLDPASLRTSALRVVAPDGMECDVAVDTLAARARS